LECDDNEGERKKLFLGISKGRGKKSFYFRRFFSLSRPLRSSPFVAMAMTMTKALYLT
jgi:hypothetical protein